MPKKNPLRNASFTLFGYNDESLDDLKRFSKLQYLYAGREICPETKRPHLQGFFQFTKEVAFSSVKRLLPTAHIEPSFGSDVDNDVYCAKDGCLFVEYGVRKAQGRRNDIRSAVQMLEEGASMRQTARENPVVYVKYHRGLEKYKALLVEPRTESPNVQVIYGPTGSGKSRSARELLPNAYVWGPEQGKWFDGYEGQPDVIFEEFRGQLPFGMMLRLLDRYDCRVETKGSTIQFVATKIVITSPVHPRDWYQMFENSEDKVDQLLRRITCIHALKGLKKKPQENI